jgi:hypothetical protein
MGNLSSMEGNFKKYSSSRSLTCIKKNKTQIEKIYLYIYIYIRVTSLFKININNNNNKKN